MKKIIINIILVLVLVLTINTVHAAGSADLGFTGDDNAIINSEFTQQITVQNIAGGKLMGVGGKVTSSDPTCLSFKTIELVDINSDANDDNAKFTYLSLAGTFNDLVIVNVVFDTGSSECTTDINITEPTISFTNGTSLKPATISKTITVGAAASNDATLKSLSVVDRTLTPTFSSDVTSYKAIIPSNIDSATIVAEVNEEHATVIGAGLQTNLAKGDNNKNVTITAEDGTTNIYVVNLYRLNDDATLKSLVVNGYNLTPTFNKETLSYEVKIPGNINSVTMTGTPTDSKAQVVGNGAINGLNMGDNIKNIDVTAEDGTTQKRYTINFKKVSNNTNLNGMTITNTANNTNISYSPTFSSSTTTYQTTVDNSVSNVRITLTKAEAGQVITGDGEKSLSIGDNSFDVVVTAEDGTTKKTYTIKIHRKSNNLVINNLKITNPSNNSNISYTPTFNVNTLTYNATVDANVNNANIEFVVGENAVVTGQGTKTLNSGLNTFSITVKSEDGSKSKTYTINITKKSSDANLTNLKITNLDNNSVINYTPTFNSNTLTYNAEVDNDVKRINLNLTKSNNNSTISGDGDKTLAIGSNTFKITVTAEDGTTKKIYTININRTEIITSIEFGHNISDGYIKTVSNIMPTGNATTVLDMKNQLDNDNSKLEIWTADNKNKLSDSAPIATGMIVKLIVNGKMTDSKVIVIKGDVNGDGDINIIDASAVVNHFLDRFYLVDAYLVAADVVEDSTINIIDASAIVNHFLDRIMIVFKP